MLEEKPRMAVKSILVIGFMLAVPSVTLAAELSFAGAVRLHLDTLVEYGTDWYGPVKTPMLMAILDVRTLESPPEPLALDNQVRPEGREHRRAPAGSNLWVDQPTLRALYQMTHLTGDERYEKAADAYATYVLKNCRLPNGLIVWGTHVYMDAFADAPAGDNGGRGPHETLVWLPLWERLWQLDQLGVRRQIEAMWEWHVVDKATGETNRHDDKRRGCDFAFSQAEFIHAFAFLYTKTKDPLWLERAKLLAEWHKRFRHPKTGLIPEAPATGMQPQPRYDSNHAFTTLPGYYCSLLLATYELTKDRYFLDLAVGYLKAYEKYGYDAKAGTYWGMIALDGTPVPDEPRGQGYDAYKPTGHVDIWPVLAYGYEAPLCAAQSCAYAAELTRSDGKTDPELLAAVNHWAAAIEKAMPPGPGRRWSEDLRKALPKLAETGGTYADGYGRAISFLVHAHRLTQNPKHRDLAEKLGREAINKLFENNLFKGHPAKPYYEALDGVGTLLCALLELHQEWNIPGAF
ncbi:MAG: hypothetical protein AMXMBFR83_06230 [Phycisphaerae bacterium]